MAKLEVVSIGKLGEYDELLKGYVGDEIESAIGDLDTANDVNIASKSGKAVTISGSVKEQNGVIAKGTATDIVLADVASTGEAEDVGYDNTTSGLTATDVQSAIDEVAAATGGGINSKTVYLRDESAGQSDYAKVYKLYQGADSSDMSQNTLVGAINIAKDKVVQDGHIVTVTSGTDSDGDTVPTGTVDGTYIKLTFQNVDTPVYINVQDLIDVYTGGTTAEATVSVSGTNEITATINKIIGTKLIYQEADETEGIPEITITAKINSLASDLSGVASDLTTLDDKVDDLTDYVGEIPSGASATDVVGYVGEAISDAVGDGIEECTTAQIQALFA